MLLFAVVVIAAVLFDMSRDSSVPEPVESHSAKGGQSHELSQVCFYNIFNSFKLKTCSIKFSVRDLFFGAQSECLKKYHSQKVGQSEKMESAKRYFVPGFKVFLVHLQKYLYHTPDDDPFRS